MKRLAVIILCICMVGFSVTCQTNQLKKVFISVDMEGVTGVVHWEEVSRTGKDYDYFRELMINGMRYDYSWNHPGQHYYNIYNHISE